MASIIRDSTKQYVEEYKNITAAFDGSELSRNDVGSMENMETLYRVYNLHKYWNTMHDNIRSGDISARNFNYLVYSRIIDSFLLGSASERISGTLETLSIFIYVNLTS